MWRENQPREYHAQIETPNEVFKTKQSCSLSAFSAGSVCRKWKLIVTSNPPFYSLAHSSMWAPHCAAYQTLTAFWLHSPTETPKKLGRNWRLRSTPKTVLAPLRNREGCFAKWAFLSRNFTTRNFLDHLAEIRQVDLKLAQCGEQNNCFIAIRNDFQNDQLTN